MTTHLGDLLAELGTETASATTARGRAAGLAEQGRLADAVMYGSAANRRWPDAQLELQLVQWRWQAFRDGTVSGRAADLPEPPNDLFPPRVTDPLPEIPVHDLSVTAVAAAIHHRGSLIVRGVLPAAGAAALVDDIDRAFAASAQAREGAPIEVTAPWYAPLDPKSRVLARKRHVVERWNNAILLGDSPRVLFNVLEWFERAGIVALVEEYLGERPVLSVEKGTLRRVAPGTNGEWHQDGRFLGQDIRALNVWVALSDCGVDAPGLDVLSRRLPFLVQSGTAGTSRSWTVSDAEVNAVADGAPIVTPHFRAGDAAIFDQLMLHRTAGRASQTKSRWAIECWFFGPSRMPHHHALVV
ncbi:MAG TPA: phytanoyl-CoA dioxygenase family protein [Vicinamibacterales bacterium]|nr:phytanoyl-CoA dioxygenase family protein [Vicinamibacterales bacterium]